MVHGALETEIKLQAGVGYHPPGLADLVPGGSERTRPEQHLHAIYVDTEDLRLARSGVTLRHRRDSKVAGQPGEWTLKLPAPAQGLAVVRQEIERPGRWGTVPAELVSLVRAFRRNAPLAPVARLVSQRTRTELCAPDGQPILEIDDDVVSVMDGRRLAARFREIEVEVVGPADEDLLNAVADRLRAAGAATGDPQPKAVRAIGFRAAEPPDVVAVELTQEATLGEVTRAAIAQGYLRLVAHDPDVRGSDDPEAVHQARVATRRLRSDLRTFRAVVSESWLREIQAELGWLADALGRVRDDDVLLERLRGGVATFDEFDAERAAGIVERLVEQRERDRVELLADMDTTRYADLLDRLVAAARTLPSRTASPEVGGVSSDGRGLGPSQGVGATPEPVGNELVEEGRDVAGPDGEAPPDQSASTPARPNGKASSPPPSLDEVGGVSTASSDRPPAPQPAPDPSPEGSSGTIRPVSTIPLGSATTPSSAVAALASAPPLTARIGGADRVGEGPPPAALAGSGSSTDGAPTDGEPAGPAPIERAVGTGGAGPTEDRSHVSGGAAPAADPGDAPAPSGFDATPDPTNGRAADAAGRVVAQPWKHLTRAVAALGAFPADDDLHMVRIRAKRLRYACEAFVPVVGRPAIRLAKAAADLQGVLGDLHDAIVAEQWIRNAIAGAPAEEGVAAGLLIALDRAEAAERRGQWPAAWAALEDKRLRAWMRG